MLNRMQEKFNQRGVQGMSENNSKEFAADDKFLYLELTKKINLERKRIATGRAKNTEVSKAIIKECAKKIGEMEAKYAMKHAENFQEWQYVQWMLGKPVLEDQNWKQKVGNDITRIDNLKLTPGFAKRAEKIIDHYFNFRRFIAKIVFNGPLDDKQAYAYWKYIVNTGLRDSLVTADGMFNVKNYDNFLEYILLNFGLSSDELAEAFGYVKTTDGTTPDWDVDEVLRLNGQNKRVTVFDRLASRPFDSDLMMSRGATQESYEDFYKDHINGMQARMLQEENYDKEGAQEVNEGFNNILANTTFNYHYPENKHPELYHALKNIEKVLKKIDDKIPKITFDQGRMVAGPDDDDSNRRPPGGSNRPGDDDDDDDYFSQFKKSQGRRFGGSGGGSKPSQPSDKPGPNGKKSVVITQVKQDIVEDRLNMVANTKKADKMFTLHSTLTSTLNNASNTIKVEMKKNNRELQVYQKKLESIGLSSNVQVASSSTTRRPVQYTMGQIVEKVRKLDPNKLDDQNEMEQLFRIAGMAGENEQLSNKRLMAMQQGMLDTYDKNELNANAVVRNRVTQELQERNDLLLSAYQDVTRQAQAREQQLQQAMHEITVQAQEALIRQQQYHEQLKRESMEALATEKWRLEEQEKEIKTRHAQQEARYSSMKSEYDKEVKKHMDLAAHQEQAILDLQAQLKRIKSEEDKDEMEKQQLQLQLDTATKLASMHHQHATQYAAENQNRLKQTEDELKQALTLYEQVHSEFLHKNIELDDLRQKHSQLMQQHDLHKRMHHDLSVTHESFRQEYNKLVNEVVPALTDILADNRQQIQDLSHNQDIIEIDDMMGDDMEDVKSEKKLSIKSQKSESNDDVIMLHPEDTNLPNTQLYRDHISVSSTSSKSSKKSSSIHSVPDNDVDDFREETPPEKPDSMFEIPRMVNQTVVADAESDLYDDQDADFARSIGINHRNSLLMSLRKHVPLDANAPNFKKVIENGLYSDYAQVFKLENSDEVGNQMKVTALGSDFIDSEFDKAMVGHNAHSTMKFYTNIAEKIITSQFKGHKQANEHKFDFHNMSKTAEEVFDTIERHGEEAVIFGTSVNAETQLMDIMNQIDLNINDEDNYYHDAIEVLASLYVYRKYLLEHLGKFDREYRRFEPYVRATIAKMYRVYKRLNAVEKQYGNKPSKKSKIAEKVKIYAHVVKMLTSEYYGIVDKAVLFMRSEQFPNYAIANQQRYMKRNQMNRLKPAKINY